MRVMGNGVAVIEHAETGRRYQISANELDWDQEGTGGRQMGDEFRHWAEVEHDELGTLIWEIYEYLVGAENYNETNVGRHKLVKDFEYRLEYEPDRPDDE